MKVGDNGLMALLGMAGLVAAFGITVKICSERNKDEPSITHRAVLEIPKECSKVINVGYRGISCQKPNGDYSHFVIVKDGWHETMYEIQK